MTLKVNKTLTGEQNLIALVQHTWSELSEVLTLDNVKFENLSTIQTPGKLQVDIVGNSQLLVGTKTVTYNVTDLESAFTEITVDELAEVPSAVSAIIKTLPCLEDDVEVGEVVTDDNVSTVTVSAAVGAYTASGSVVVNVIVTEPPLDLGNDLTGDELNGFDQSKE